MTKQAKISTGQYWVAGNVGLEPFTASQFDLGVEWYFAEGFMLSVTTFYKDVANFVTISEYHADASEIDYALPDREAAFGWRVQEKDNGKNAKIKAIELGYQQGFGNGFGAIANSIWTDISTDKNTFTDGNRLNGDFGSPDASAVWHATDHIDVEVDANNLLAEDAEQFGNNADNIPGSGFTPDFPLYAYETARQINLGVSAQF